MSNWNASDNGLYGIKESLYRIAGYLERKEEREIATKDAPVERDLEKTRSTGEPLIKDEKIRKAVRAWTEACFNDNEFWVVDLDERNFTLKANRSDAKATFYSANKLYGIEDDGFYTITELCGEEEDG